MHCSPGRQQSAGGGFPGAVGQQASCCPPWPGEEQARQDCLLASCWVAVRQVLFFFQWQQEESCIWHRLICAQI